MRHRHCRGYRVEDARKRAYARQSIILRESPCEDDGPSEIGFTRFRQTKCASRINPTCVVKPAGDKRDSRPAYFSDGCANATKRKPTAFAFYNGRDPQNEEGADL